MKKYLFVLLLCIPLIATSQNKVGINTHSPQARLDIQGSGITGDTLLRFSTDRPWVFRQTSTGAFSKLSLQSTVNSKMFEILSSDSTNRAAIFHSHDVHSNVLLVPDGGEAGVGVLDPTAKFHIAHNSSQGWPTLRLTELDDDFARIKMESSLNPGAYWDISGKADTITANSKLNIYFRNATNAGDRMTITGIGDVGIGNTNPEARLDILGGDWNLEAGNAGDLRIGNATHNLRFGVATGGGGAGIGRIFAGGGLSRLIFGTSNQDRIEIDDNGNFSINNLSGSGDRNVIVDSNGKFKIGTLGAGDTDWTETTDKVISQKTARVVSSVTTGQPPFTFTTANYLDVNPTNINTWQSFNNGTPYGTNLRLQNDSNGDIILAEGGGSVGVGAAPASKLTVQGPENDGSVAAFEVRTSPLGSRLLFDNNEIDLEGPANTLFINANTNKPVAIGTFSPAAGYMLSVDGKVIAEEMRVQLTTAWPDYVFEDSYELMPLQKVNDEIKRLGHLPGIPSADQIESDGLDMGDMQKRMMEKIEELTLYLIDQQKEIERLRKLVEEK
jgi:hypothetical protein